MKDYMYRDNIDKFPVAMAYVPWQHFNGICDNLEEGYCEGTILTNHSQEGDAANHECALCKRAGKTAP